MATSCLMMIAIMGVIGKITFGRASESFTARKTLILSIFFQGVGTLILCISGNSTILWVIRDFSVIKDFMVITYCSVILFCHLSFIPLFLIWFLFLFLVLFLFSIQI